MKTTKRYARVLAAALCAVLLLSGAPALAESYATVRGGGLNLRQTASLDAKVLGQYKTGTWITVLESGKEWSKVQVDGKTGYMMSKYLNAAAAASVLYVRTNTGIGLNLRTAPSMAGKIITSFRPGTPVTVLKKGSGWYYVAVCGLTGYMGSQYLVERKKDQGIGKPNNGSFQAKLYNPNGGKIVNFRQGAGLNARIIRAYPVGTPVTVLEEGSNWCKVQIEGRTGYVSTYFLKR